MGAVINLLNKKIANFHVIKRLENNKHSAAVWLCRCVCGKEKPISSGALLSGGTVSCGCVGKKNRLISSLKHGMCGTVEYRTWRGMRERCHSKSHMYFKNYGGRGIKVCDRWLSSFDAFFADMGNKPSPSHSIDRINNDGDYEPSNCRWATRKEQMKNTRIKSKTSLPIGEAVHKGKKLFEAKYGSQMELLEIVKERLGQAKNVA